MNEHWLHKACDFSDLQAMKDRLVSHTSLFSPDHIIAIVKCETKKELITLINSIVI